MNAPAVGAAAGSAEEAERLRAGLEAERERASAEAAKQQAELLEMQNKVLMEQVAQMQKLMAEQSMSMQRFMQTYPVNPNEPMRRLVVEVHYGRRNPGLACSVLLHPVPC